MKGKHMDERRPGFVNIRSFTYSRTRADPPEDAEYDFASRHRAAPRPIIGLAVPISKHLITIQKGLFTKMKYKSVFPNPKQNHG